MPVDEQWDNSDVGDADKSGSGAAPTPVARAASGKAALPAPRPAASAPPPVARTPAPAAASAAPPLVIAPAPPLVSAPAPLVIAPAPPTTPAGPVDSSLMLLAKDLMPPTAPAVAIPDVSTNVGRTVRALPAPTRAWRFVRKTLRLDHPKQRWIAIGAAGALVLGIGIAATRSSPPATHSAADLAKHAHELVGAGKYRDGIAAYETLLVSQPQTAASKTTIADLARVADDADPKTAATALAALASQVAAPGRDELLARTLSKSADVRHQAFALADGAGVGDRIDRVASWKLDLEQAASCDERRDILAKIVDTKDKRVPAIRQREAARGGCDAAAATAATAAPKPGAPPAAKPASTTKRPASQPATHHRPKPHW